MKEMPHPVVNPYEQNRKPTRMKNFDYSCSGIYFVTFCTYTRVCYMGDIVNGVMQYAHQGCVAHSFLKMAHKIFIHKKKEIDMEILNFAVMPDHIHILISISNPEADLRAFEQGSHSDTDIPRYAQESLSSLVGSIKSAITRECHILNFDVVWQSGFFDHVVRNQRELNAIHKYIDENPLRWEIDKNRNDVWM